MFCRYAVVVLLSAVVIGLPTGVHAQSTLFVDGNATGGNNGLTWEDAFNRLEDALLAAEGSGGVVTQIWVATGVYTPSELGNRTESFQLLNNLAVYGGFAGGEESLDERDPAANETILSGDLDGDDGTGGSGSNCCIDRPDPGCDDPSCQAAVCAVDSFCCGDRWDDACVSLTICLCGDLCSDQCDNSFHVVTTAGVNPTAVLDGFTIKGGFATDDAGVHVSGGGVYNAGGSPTIRNCVLQQNAADQSGAGFFSTGGAPRVFDSRFLQNTAGMSVPSSGIGGGFASVGGTPLLVGCTLIANESLAGGALGAQNSAPKVFNSLFRDNVAQSGGGVDSNGGNPVLMNCLFNDNDATTSGGAVRCHSGSTASVRNSTFSNNFAPIGGGISLSGSGPSVIGCILWGNSDATGTDEDAQIDIISGQPTVNYCIIQGYQSLGGVGNLGDDPLFVDADGPDNVPGSADDNFRLQRTSPAVDAGSNSAVPSDAADLDGDLNFAEPTPLDLDLGPRFVDGAYGEEGGEGNPPIVDMGAYEQNDCNNNGVPDDQDILEGTSLDCNGNQIPDECDLDGGLSLDCQPNGVPDECDIADETSFDLNQNGIPDECEDCQPNGLPDFIDILYHVSEDCNGNEVPDECDTRDGTSLDCQEDEIPDECQLVDNDCNTNGIPDECDVTSGFSEDCNGNLVPDECEADFDGDGLIDDCDPDIDGDGVPNANDVCPYTPLGQEVNEFGGPRGDANGDCDVDNNDYFFFEICLSISGPDYPPLFQDCVQLFDLDDDGDVDMRDFAIFQYWFTGELP